MKKIFILLGICLISVSLFAQKMPEGALNIGDQIPDITIRNLVNSSTRTARLTDYKGKLIILDFWFTHCVPCVSALPHMQELQNKFGDKVKMLFVTTDRSDNEEKILNVFKGVTKRTGINMNIPSSLFDAEINRLFPCKSNPYEVWIDPSGKVVAFTDVGQVTETHINEVLSGKTAEIKMRYDFTDQSKPLTKSGESNNDSLILFQSVFSKYRPGLMMDIATKTDKTGRMIGYSLINQSLIGIYLEAYPAVFTKGNGHIVFKTRDSLLFKNVNLRKDYNKLFCYDLYMSGGCTKDDIPRILKEDLNRTFHHSIQNEKQIVPCLIIKTNKKIEKLVSKGGPRDGNLNQYKLAGKNNVPVYYYNGDIGHLQFFLEPIFKSSASLVETDFKQNIDLDFPVGFDFNNLELLKSYLQNKGIDLSFENRELDVVVIGDKMSK